MLKSKRGFQMLRPTSLRAKLFVPVAIVLTVVVLTAALVTASMLSSSDMNEFRERLITHAVTSRSMIHSAAEELAKSKGYAFHRYTDLGGTSGDVHQQMYHEVTREFAANPSMEVVVK